MSDNIQLFFFFFFFLTILVIIYNPLRQSTVSTWNAIDLFDDERSTAVNHERNIFRNPRRKGRRVSRRNLQTESGMKVRRASNSEEDGDDLWNYTIPETLAKKREKWNLRGTGSYEWNEISRRSQSWMIIEGENGHEILCKWRRPNFQKNHWKRRSTNACDLQAEDIRREARMNNATMTRRY